MDRNFFSTWLGILERILKLFKNIKCRATIKKTTQTKQNSVKYPRNCSKSKKSTLKVKLFNRFVCLKKLKPKVEKVTAIVTTTSFWYKVKRPIAAHRVHRTEGKQRRKPTFARWKPISLFRFISYLHKQSEKRF